MDVSVWWVVIGASIGLCVGIVLFAILTMASDREGETFPDPRAPAQN